MRCNTSLVREEIFILAMNKFPNYHSTFAKPFLTFLTRLFQKRFNLRLFVKTKRSIKSNFRKVDCGANVTKQRWPFSRNGQNAFQTFFLSKLLKIVLQLHKKHWRVEMVVNCDTVGRPVSSDTRGPGFESSHQQFRQYGVLFSIEVIKLILIITVFL